MLVLRMLVLRASLKPAFLHARGRGDSKAMIQQLTAFGRSCAHSAPQCFEAARSCVSSDNWRQKTNFKPMWKKLMSNVDLEERSPIMDPVSLGCTQCKVRH